MVVAFVTDSPAGSPMVGGILFAAFGVLCLIAWLRPARCRGCGRAFCRVCGRQR